LAPLVLPFDSSTYKPDFLSIAREGNALSSVGQGVLRSLWHCPSM